MLLVDVFADAEDLGECDIQNHEDTGVALLNHAADAVDVHAGVDGVCGGTELIQCIDGENGFGYGYGQEGDNFTGLYAEGGEGVGAFVHAVEELSVCNIVAVVAHCYGIDAVSILLLHVAIGGALGQLHTNGLFGEILQPGFAYRGFLASVGHSSISLSVN